MSRKLLPVVTTSHSSLARSKLSYALACLTCLAFLQSQSSAAILYESGSLGPTGVSWNDLVTQSVPGTNVNSAVFPGVRFKLSQQSEITQIGGHFVAPSASTFFGALVRLDNQDDFPDSLNLSTSDVLATTILNFSTSSAEVFGNIHATIDPGWYAVVFGSGLFGATGAGGAVRNGMDIGDPSYIAFGLNLGWHNLDLFPNPFNDHRFVVIGQLVPECRSLVCGIFSLIMPLLMRKARRNRYLMSAL